MSAADLLMKSYFAAWVKETPRTPGYVAGNVNTMHLAQLYDDFRAAEARIRELEEAFLKYGQHLGSCAGPGKCDCGFREALASRSDRETKP
jgi:hypothetical protein